MLVHFEANRFLQISSIVLVVSVCNARISIGEFNGGVYKMLDNRSMELAIRQSLEDTENIFTSDTVTYVGLVIDKVPYIGEVTSLVLQYEQIISENAWKDALVKSISEQTELEIVKSKMEDIRDIINNINIELSEMNTTNVADYRRMKATMIKSDLNKIMSIFSKGNSMLRTHLELIYPMLSALAPMVSVFEMILSKIAPDIWNESLLSCRLTDILIEFQFILYQDRLYKLYAYHNGMAQYHSGRLYNKKREVPIRKLLCSSFDSNIFAQHRFIDFNSIGCEGKVCKNETGYVCLREAMFNENIHIGSLAPDVLKLENPNDLWQLDSCVNDYAKLIAYQLKNAFDKSLNLLSKSCTKEKRIQRRNNNGKKTYRFPIFIFINI